MRKTLTLIVLLIAVAQNSFGSKFPIEIESNGSIPKETGEIHIIFEGNISDYWTTKNAITYMARSLDYMGYEIANNTNDASYILRFSIGLGEEKEITETKKRVIDSSSSSGASSNYVDGKIITSQSNESFNNYEYYDITEIFHICWLDIKATTTNGEEIFILHCDYLTQKDLQTALPYLFASTLEKGHLCSPSGGAYNWSPMDKLFALFEKKLIKRVKEFLNKPYNNPTQRSQQTIQQSNPTQVAKTQPIEQQAVQQSATKEQDEQLALNTPITFNDNAFLKALISNGVDKNGDNIITIQEALEVSELIITLSAEDYKNKNYIVDFRGIEYFKNLKSLYAPGAMANIVDLSQNPKIENVNLLVSTVNQLIIPTGAHVLTNIPRNKISYM